jgi:hypothetical protein
VSKPGTKEAWDVLQQNCFRSNFIGQANDVSVQSSSMTVSTGTAPPLGLPKAGILAGEATADDIHGNSICGELASSEGSHVVILGHLWPMLREDAATERIDLAEGDCLEAASALKPKAEAANAGKKIEDAELAHAATFVDSTDT